MVRKFCAGSVLFLGILAGLVDAAEVPRGSIENERQLAFPGAEGFGRFARGGRGGDVYHVTTLADDGPGSLRDAIRTASGPRTIIFDVSGTIELKSRLTLDKSFITIAGQTAPGDGICIKDHTFRVKDASHIIIRYVRFRLGDENKTPPAGDDTLNTDDIDHVIFDHISASWGVDGNHDLRRGGNFTLQWSLYAEALNDSIHGKGPHAMLGSFRDLTASITLHHNLFASSRDRHPTLGGSPGTKPESIVDFRNNVIYNFEGTANLGNCRINVVDNYFRPGPNTPADHLPLAIKAEIPGATRVYAAGNVFEGVPEWGDDNYRAVDFVRWTKGNYLPLSLAVVRADREFDVGDNRPVTQTAQEAYEIVIREAGASLARDDVDRRIVEGVRDRTNRMIDSQAEVGGFPTLRSAVAPKDRDGDGMPDAWEAEQGFDPDDGTDGNLDRNQDGFTNLEEYLNSLAKGK